MSLLLALASSGTFAQEWKQWIDTAYVSGRPTQGSLTKPIDICTVQFNNIRTSCKDKALEETTIDDWARMQFSSYCTSDTTVGLASGIVWFWVNGKQTRGDDVGGDYDFILKIPEVATDFYGYHKILKINRLDSWSFSGVTKRIKGIIIPKSVSYVNPLAIYNAQDVVRISVEEGSPYFSNYNGYCLYDAEGTTLMVCPYRGTFGQYFKDGIVAIGSDVFSHHSCKSLSLPATIKKIGDRAFYGCQLKRIDVPDACEEIGTEAFGGDLWYDCDTLFLGRNLRTIGYHAFSFYQWAPNSRRSICIVCKATTPPESIREGLDPFDLCAKKSIKLLVPEGSVEAYRNHWVWGQFSVIGDPSLNPVEVEPDDPTSLSDPEADGLRVRVDGRDILFDGETDVEVFTLGGLRLYAGRTASLSIASPGIYLVSAGGSSAKVQIR